MPAVNPTRLSFQIAALLPSFESPEEFHKKLKGLFSLYANRALRRREQPGIPLLIPAYHLPNPVMRQLKTELTPVVAGNPQAALALADVLWRDETFEVRQAAIFILGQTPVAEPDPIFSRLNQWLTPDLEPSLKEELLESGTQSLQSKFSKRWEAWIKSLLTHKNPQWITIGLIGLRKGLKLSPGNKIPTILRLVSPFIRDPQPEIMNELKRMLEALSQHAPTETGYFLKQALSLSNSARTARLVRGCLPAFPDEIQKELQQALKQTDL